MVEQKGAIPMVSQTTQDYREIEKVIQTYTAGGNGDLEALRSVFLPSAIINGSPIQELYDIVTERGKTDSTSHIDFIDITGPVASTKIIIEDWHGANFVEYFHLLKTMEGWKISSKTGIGFAEG
jgi:hypothetical protein